MSLPLFTVQVGHLQIPDVRGIFPDDPAYSKRFLSDIARIVVHHSVTPGVEATAHDELATMKAIWQYHRETHGWPGIGYHCCVFPSGRTYLTGGAEDIRYHVADQNRDTYGICMIGTFHADGPPAAQLQATARYIAELRYGLGAELPVVGHRDLMQTECPGDTWEQWRKLLTVPPAVASVANGGTVRAILLPEIAEMESRLAAMKAKVLGL